MKSVVEVNLPLLSALKAQHKYSTSDLAYLLGYKTPTGYWLIEQGRRKISLNALYQLAKLYGYQMEDLLIVHSK